jgi:cytochrome c553
MKGKIEPRDIAFAAAGLSIAIAGGLAVFITSGIYNVSAARPHLDPTVWLLDLVRRQSIAFHSRSVEVPPLTDPGAIRLGARHFVRGCAGCHGAPGHPANAITGGMLPEPPTLSASLDDWSVAELFWIIQNGQKYTGMPAWLAHDREDEIWAVAAFVSQLTKLDQKGYESLAGISEDEPPGFPFQEHDRDGVQAIIADCAACHGRDGAEPVAEAVPTIGGQLASYLERTLLQYHNGGRPSGFMQPAASMLTESQIVALAAHFGGGALRPRPAPGVDEETAARGAVIFKDGVPEGDVPACDSCHDNGADEGIPRLLGQSAVFVRQQLELWQQDIRSDAGYGAIMAPVARRLTPQQVADVATYIASSGTPAGGSP